MCVAGNMLQSALEHEDRLLALSGASQIVEVICFQSKFCCPIILDQPCLSAHSMFSEKRSFIIIFRKYGLTELGLSSTSCVLFTRCLKDACVRTFTLPSLGLWVIHGWSNFLILQVGKWLEYSKDCRWSWCFSSSEFSGASYQSLCFGVFQSWFLIVCAHWHIHFRRKCSLICFPNHWRR